MPKKDKSRVTVDRYQSFCHNYVQFSWANFSVLQIDNNIDYRIYGIGTSGQLH